ncbi:MAG: type II secretion system protein J, partial [Rhodospirillales bacterium]
MNSRPESGFTLIELMVSLVLVGLIVSALAGALRTGLLGAGVVQKRVERIGEVRIAHGLIRRQLETAWPVSWSENQTVYAAFEGTPESLAFITVMPPWPGLGGPHLVRIARRGEALVLTRRITS